MTLNYRELKRRYDLDGSEQTTRHLTEALAAGDLRAEDFSLRDLAEALVPEGREWVRMLDPRASGGVSGSASSGGADASANAYGAGQGASGAVNGSAGISR